MFLLDKLLKVALSNQEFDLIFELLALLHHVANVLVIGAILVLSMLGPWHSGLGRWMYGSLAITFMICFLLTVKGCTFGVFGEQNAYEA